MKAILPLLLALPSLVVSTSTLSQASPQPSVFDLEPAGDANDAWPLKDRQGNVVGELRNFVQIPDFVLSRTVGIAAMKAIQAEANEHFDPEVTIDYRYPRHVLSVRDEQFELRGPGERPGGPITWLLIWEVSTALTEYLTARQRWRRGYNFEVTNSQGQVIALGYNGLKIFDEAVYPTSIIVL